MLGGGSKPIHLWFIDLFFLKKSGNRPSIVLGLKYQNRWDHMCEEILGQQWNFLKFYLIILGKKPLVDLKPISFTFSLNFLLHLVYLCIIYGFTTIFFGRMNLGIAQRFV
jgi:hypothetical protein